MFFRGIPCPPYIVRGAGLQIWKPILASYNCHMWPDKDSYSNRPGSCLIAKSALTPCAGLQPGWLGRASSFGWTGPIDSGRPKLSRKGIGVNTPTCLLILPLFVAICEIWLPGLTYSVYPVLSLKSGAISHMIQSNTNSRYNSNSRYINGAQIMTNYSCSTYL